MQHWHQHPSSGTSTRSIGGFSIIEVLVALIVVSIGMLGVAGLQLTGMKHSTGGFNRSKATLYAEDIASRMRLNSVGVENEAYNGHDSSGGYCATFAGPRCDASPVNPAASCSPDELAAFDLYSVSCGVDGTSGVAGDNLPNAVLTVNCDTAPCGDGEWAISVQWTEVDSISETRGDTRTREVLMRMTP